MSFTDNFTNLMGNSAPGAVPSAQPLSAPAPVTPSVVTVKPRINPAAGKPATSANPDPTSAGTGAPGSKPAPSSSGSGNSGLQNYLSDVAGGILTVPQNSDAISAFAYGFAGAIKSRDARKLADKNAALTAQKEADAKTQQEFNNMIALKNLHVNDMVDGKGGLTVLGIAERNKQVDAFVKDNGYTAASLKAMTPEDAAAARKAIDDYRRQIEADIKGASGYDTLASDNPPGLVHSGGATAPSSDAVAANVRPGEEGVHHDGPFWNPLDKGTTTYPGNPAGNAPAAPAAAAAPKGDKQPAAKGVNGSGTHEDPYDGGFVGDEAGIAKIQAAVPSGKYFKVTDPATGKSVIRQMK